MAQGPKIDPGELARAIERVAEGRDLQDWGDPKPAVDPKQQREFRDESVHGRRFDDYRRALEHAGFGYVPAHKLGFWNDGTPHREGLWVSFDYDLGLAFTEDDVLTMFPGGPAEFHDWVTDKKRQLAARKAGIIL